MAVIEARAFDSGIPGKRLIVLGAVHGNEVCGPIAIRRVLQELDSGALKITAGAVTFVPVTNQLAYAQGTRRGDRDLNRNMAMSPTPQDNEDRIANELCPLLAAHDVLLDLHSFHSQGEPFLTLGPKDNDGDLQPFNGAALEESLAMRLGVHRAMDGWLDTYAAGVARRGGNYRYGVGTTEYMRSVGGCALTLECGQHQDLAAPDVGYTAIHNTLLHLGLVDGTAPEPVKGMQCFRLQEVVDREHEADRFARPWRSFDAVSRGELIATRGEGPPLLAPYDGYVVFPNERSPAGSEWLYFAAASNRLT